jgi:hypothetical protein
MIKNYSFLNHIIGMKRMNSHGLREHQFDFLKDRINCIPKIRVNNNSILKIFAGSNPVRSRPDGQNLNQLG